MEDLPLTSDEWDAATEAPPPLADLVPDTGVAAGPLEQVLAYVREQALHNDVEAPVMDAGAPFEVEAVVSELRAVAVRLAAEVERLTTDLAEGQ